MNGAAETAFVGSGVGGPYYQDASWIQGPPNSYVFTLYDYSSGSRGASLGSKTVTGVYAATLTWGNSSNTVITPNIVVGDYWALSISGAAPSASIDLHLTENGGSMQVYHLANAGSNGQYNQSAQVTSASVGTYTNQWYVGGVPVGLEYDYEVIYKPEALSLVSTPYVEANCTPSQGGTYGILGGVVWKFQDSAGNPVTSSNIVLYPYATYNNGPLQQVTSSPNGAEQSTGIFDFYPIGHCASGPYSGAQEANLIYAKIGVSTIYDLVRNQTWTASSNAPNTGILFNSIDVSISQ
jgi:hypothetical protein